MNIVWAQAALYEPPTVLGKILRGFSPFHALILEAVQSPFMTDAAADFDDLVLAVHICSHGWDDRFRIQSDIPAVTKWGKTVPKKSITPARKDFDLYLKESLRMPQFWQAGGGDEPRANWLYHIATFAQARLHMVERDAWDCPIARLVCYRACVSEVEGDKSLKSESESEGVDVLKADAAKAAEKEKANGAS